MRKAGGKKRTTHLGPGRMRRKEAFVNLASLVVRRIAVVLVL